MNNWVIKTASKKDIVVVNGKKLTMNDTDIFCCNGFWSGIFLDVNSELILSACEIEDAENAVQCLSNAAKVSSIATTFNRNKVGILWDYQGSGYAGMQTPLFSANTFSCTSPRNDNVSTSDAGIILDGGTGSFHTALTNKFERQQTGIRINNSNFNVKSCKFEDCFTGIELNNSYCEQTGLGKDNTTPTFTHCNIGILAINSGMTVQENYFFEYYGTGVVSDGKAKTPVSILKNRFETTFSQYIGDYLPAGIELLHNTIYSDFIYNNQFDVDGELYCIVIPGFYSCPKNLNLFNNYMNIGLAVGEVCELQMGSSGCSVAVVNNHVNGETADSFWGGFHFHDFNKQKQHFVERSSVDFINMSLAFPRAFYSINSAIEFCDNITNNVSIGFDFAAVCLGTVFSKSQIGFHRLGVQINGSISPQDRTGNCWLPASAYTEFAARMASGSVLQNKFTVDQTIPCHYPVGSISPPNLFDPLGSGENPCSFQFPAGGVIDELDEKILSGEISQMVGSDVEVWDAQRYLFRKLAAHPELRPAGSSAANFFQIHTAGLVGQYDVVEKIWSNAGIVTESLENNYLNKLADIREHLSEIARLDSLLELSPNNATLQNLAAAEFTAMASLMIQLDSFLNLVNLASTQSFENVLTQYENLNSQTLYQWNEKRIRVLNLERIMENRSFTEGELNEIRSIAEQCYFDGGQGVSVARTLLPHAEQEIFETNDYDFNCGSNREDKQTVRGSVKIFPVPASDFIVIKPNEETWKLVCLTDMMGKIVNQSYISGQSSTFVNVSTMPSGIYLCQLFKENGESFSQKIIISR